MSKNNFILIIFLNLFLIGNTGNNYYTNQRSTSSIGGNSGGGNGGLGRNSFGKYGQYYGNNNNNELEEWNNEKEQRLLLKHSEITSASFISEDYCIERCQISCSSSFVYISRDKDPQIQFNCLKLKPPERKLHEKLVASITSASFFEFFIAGIIILSIGICCLCSCYQCFCKNPQIIHRNRGRHCVVENDNKNIPPDGIITSFNGTGGTTSTGVSPEHDPLVNEKIPHIDEGIQSAPFISNNNGGSGIGFNHHHQHNLNQHHYIKTTNNSFNKNCGGGEHSIV